MRNPFKVRPCKITLGPITNVTGSAYLEIGETKVYATVRGPIPTNRSTNPTRGVVRCTYEMANFGQLSRRKVNRRNQELSLKLQQVFEENINLSQYIGQEIHLHAYIISPGGSTRCAAIAALSVALVHAGIKVYSLIPAISFGKYQGELMLDLNTEEDNNGEADFAIAFDPFNNNYLLQQMDGILTIDEIRRGLEMAQRGLFYIYYIQKTAIFEYFNSRHALEGYENLHFQLLQEGQRLFNLSVLATEETSQEIKIIE